jgi:hypothetical protein
LGLGVLTLIAPYYENPSMLALQMVSWAGWADKRKQRLRVIIIDDGSPNYPAVEVERPDGLPSLQIYRVLEDIPWHQHGARNLGAHVCEGGWMLMTDMDHMLTEECARALFKRADNGQLDDGTVYTMARVEADTGLPTLDQHGREKPHPNSFVLTRDLYWRIGGYDEDWCGVYGTDSLFRERAFRIGKRGHIDCPLTRYWRDIIPDASTNGLPRKEGRDPGAKARILAGKRARGEQDTVKTLQFEWERVL